jgi:hypothetical protein
MIIGAYVNHTPAPHPLTTTTVVPRRPQWPPQLTTADAHTERGHPGQSCRVLYSRHEIQTLHVPESYQSYSLISPSNSAREEPLRCVKLSPLSNLHGSGWRRGASLRDSPCRVTCIPRCAPWSAVGTERNGGLSPCRGSQVATRGKLSRGFALSSPCALLVHHGKV